MRYLLHNFAELAERRARLTREEAELWDILSRDLKRAAKENDQARKDRPARPNPITFEANQDFSERICLRIKEAQKVMGLSRGSLYKEIGAGRLPVRKAGRTTLIAMKDIHAWFESLPEGLR